MTRGFALLSASIAALVVSAACTVSQSDTAPVTPTGPTDFAQSVSITATPDNLTQDGASQSSIVVRILDAKAQPAVGVPVRLEILAGGQVVDFGTLSTKSIVTGTDGRAIAVYTAPPAPPATAGGTPSRVTIRATALGNNAQGDIPYTVDIRLVPVGVILPPAGTPTATFVTTPSNPTANGSVNFDASASTPGSGSTSITSYAWSFGDGTTGSGRTISHTYATPNTYSVTLTVTNDRGLSASITLPVNVGASQAPAASFVFSPTSPSPGQTISFNGSASNASVGHTIVSSTWDFGDGTTGSGLTASHAFRLAGTYNVVFVVTDDTGQRATATQIVTVSSSGAASPTANFTFSPTAPGVGDTVFFNATSSAAGAGHTLTSASWDFGDGTSGSGATPTHSYARVGTFTVTLTVRDESGQVATKSNTVPVSSGTSTVPPTASFVFSPGAPAVNQVINFNAEASRATSGRTIVSYSWNFGDGSTVTLNGATATTTTHTYTVAGTYNVTLTVTDDAGQRGTTASAVTVVPAAGGGGGTAAAFTFSPTNPVVNQLVAFNGSGSTAATGRTITSYAWDFGDIACPPANPSCTSTTTTTPSTSHQFAAAGTFNVLLVVTDSAGQTGRFSAPVTVASASQGNLTAEFSMSPTDPRSGQLVTFNANTSTAGGGATITSYDWDFGDGTVVNGQTSFLINHTYFTQFAPSNQFTIRLTVHDTLGRSASVTHPLTVIAGTDPTARFTVSPSPAAVGATVTFDGSSSTAVAPKTIARFTWDFGDGSPLVSRDFPTATITHPYAAAGTYVITLTVTDSQGLATSTTRTLVVQ